jgi:predicted cupin superfamily sugar epimerase
MNAVEIIHRLGLRPHPEGGHYREVYRHVPAGGGRGDLTVIYFLLAAGECSAWHRIDATEVWHYHAGAPLRLDIGEEGGEIRSVTLGTDFAAGETAQGIVPPHAWQSARSLGAWTLVGCTVAPAFLFETFEMAPEGWTPEAGKP